MKATFAIFTLSALMMGSAHAGMSYECWTHKGGSPDKMVQVVADNKSDAVQLAIEKFKSIGVTPNSVTCK